MKYTHATVGLMKSSFKTVLHNVLLFVPFSFGLSAAFVFRFVPCIAWNRHSILCILLFEG